MKILDSQGRLFGRVSILDVGAALVILLVVVGIFIFPGTSGSVAQIGSAKPVEVDLIVRGLSVRNPQTLFGQGLSKGGKIKIIIRNQPAGEVGIKSVRPLSRTVLVPQPDGSIKALTDPRPDQFSTDMLLTLEGQAQITKDGFVVGNKQLKIGTTVELESKNYDFNATVIDIRANS
jgi:hypothetical protein